VPTRARLAIAGVVALASAIGIGIIVVHLFHDDETRAAAPLHLRETAATAPFAGYREARIETNGKCVRVVLADTEARRERGLRGTHDLGPYAGMLFVQPDDTDIMFTMAGVSDPLDIAWYAADGSRVGSERMQACAGPGGQCPGYGSPRAYRFALETPAGGSPGVSVSPCV